MEFQFLGTGAGMPSKTRNVSALALRTQGASLVAGRLRRGDPAPHPAQQLVAARPARGMHHPHARRPFSPRYQDQGPVTIADVDTEARAAYGGQLFLARDFDRYLLDRHGRLSRME